MNGTTYNRVIIALTVMLFALPIGLDVIVNGWKRVIAYFAPDAFYYLTVSRNFAIEGFFTYDQQYPTNGFHPLWQVVEGIFYRLALPFNAETSTILVVLLTINILCIGTAIILLGKTFLTELPRLPLTFMLLPIGIFVLVTAPVNRTGGGLWNLANGMESGLVILSYAVLMFLMVRPKFLESYASAVLAGLLLGMLFLSRLDHGLFAIAFVIIFGLQGIVARQWFRFRYLAVSCAVVGVILIAYMASNLVTVGLAVPVSAVMKSHFPVPLGVLNDKFLIISRVIADPSRGDFREVVVKTMLMALPFFCAIGFLVWSFVRLVKQTLTPLDRGLSVTSLFVILLALYNFLYVAYPDQGGWYFPVSTLFLTLLVIRFSGGAFVPSGEIMPKKILVEMAVVAGLVVVFFLNDYWGDYNNTFTRFLTERAPELKQYYAGQSPKLLEYDDGIIAYSTDFPTMSGMGFTLDAEGVGAKKANQLLALAYVRGYDRIASSSYFNASGLTPDTPSAEIAERLGKTFFLFPPEVKLYKFHVEYTSADGHFAVIRFAPTK